MSTKKFRGKYRIDSARLKHFDYATDGAYFITIVTKNRTCFLGEIIDTDNHKKMVKLSDIGKIAEKYWYEIPKHFPFIKLDEMVVMPNHIHGILWIVGGRDVACNVSTGNAPTQNAPTGNAPTPIAPTGNAPPPNAHARPKNKQMAKISPKQGSLSTVVRSFKSAVTKKSREFFPGFGWQPRFHDHIIRNNGELNRIRQYIINNPQMWTHDCNNR